MAERDDLITPSQIFQALILQGKRQLYALDYFEDLVPTSKAKMSKGGCKANQNNMHF